MNSIIVALKKLLDEGNGKVKIIYEGGEIVPHTCSFNPPATAGEINQLEAITGFKLPEDYRNFLEACNGCSLFDHHLYGGEAFIFSTNEVIEYYQKDDIKNILQVARIYGDIIVIDFDKVNSNENDYIFIKDSILFYHPGRNLYCNFDTWLYRYISSYGTKYWDFNTEPKI